MMTTIIARTAVVAALCLTGLAVAGTASAVPPSRDANGNLGCTKLVAEGGRVFNKNFAHNDEYTDEKGVKEKCNNGNWEKVRTNPQSGRAPGSVQSGGVAQD